MKWTNEKPTIEGWYFWRSSKNHTDSLHFEAYYIEPDIQLRKGLLNGQWAGPIMEPDDAYSSQG